MKTKCSSMRTSTTKSNRPCAKAWTNHPHLIKPMNKNTDYHMIEHIIAIVLSLICSLINNITGTKRWLSTSTPTPATCNTVAQKKGAGGTTAVRRSSRSSTRAKTTTSGATSKTGTSSKKSGTRRPTRTPKAVVLSPSVTQPEDILSSQGQTSQTNTSSLTISIPASKNTSQKSTLKKDLVTAE